MPKKKLNYDLKQKHVLREIPAPRLPYVPADPRRYKPRIGLIGCGGISEMHLSAYRSAGYQVIALCSRTRRKAHHRREQFYPRAEVYTDYRQVLDRDDIDVVDVTTHPDERLPILRDALMAGKHILSQKPFVLDLRDGQKLVELAKKQKVKLAVNQNGRWAPHFAYIRHAIARGLLGEVMGAHLSVHWDHNWVAGTKFDEIRHLILCDFAIHWFDILTCFMGGTMANRVYASFTHAPEQQAKPALLAQALVEYDHAQSTLAFDASARFGGQDRTYVCGTKGSIMAYSTAGSPMQVTMYTARGVARPKLAGQWFPDGFHGTMGELLRAIEEDREPYNSAENNLKSLALCFAAIASAETGKAQTPGKVTKLLA